MEEFLSPNEIAKQLRVSALTVRRWIREGLLEAENTIEGKRHRYAVKKSIFENIRQEKRQILL